MKRIPWILLSVLGAAVGCSRAEGIDPGSWNAYRNPVEQSDVQDPAVIEEDGTFYLFSSEVVSGDTEEYIPTMTSKDLTSWTAGTSVFDDLDKPSFISGGKLQSPDIARVDGRYLLYYTLFVNASNCGIGVAEAEFASGPYTDRGALLTTASTGLKGVVSPSFFTDGTDNYLVFGNLAGIYLVQLSADGLSVTGTPVQIADESFVAPALVRHDGKFYLFASTGTTIGGAVSTSHLVYGRADRVDGPYCDRSLREMLDGNAEKLVGVSTKFAGPGNGCVLSLRDGSDWMLYNAYDLSAIDKGRTLMLDRIVWKDGWASIRGAIGSFSAEAPALEL